MKKQKKILLFILILFLIAIAIVLFFFFRNNKTNYDPIKITWSDFSISAEEKNITITDKEKIKKISDMCNNLKSGSTDDVSSTIIHNYTVTLGNGTKITMDSTIYNYGYVQYKNSDELKFIRLPEGLLEYIKEICNS